MADVKRFFRKLLRSIRKRLTAYGVFSKHTKTLKKHFFPAWVVDELTELSAIEPDLFPSSEFLERYTVYHAPQETAPGLVYGECLRRIGSLQPDIILLVPWLMRGGADLGALHHARAAVFQGKTPLLIATLNADSPWKERVPSEACFLEFGIIGKDLSDDQRLLVLARLVMQSSASVVHIINSQLGWEMVKRYGKALKTLDKRLFASVYCDDVDSYNVRWSYPRFYFPSCYGYLTGLICDSVWYPQSLKRQFGINTDKIKTIYFPTDVPSGITCRSAGISRVLWAGRLTLQKRPDILVAIARQMPQVSFDVYGYVYDSDGRKYRQELERLPNVQLCGSYESFDDLIRDRQYALFLYTSAWDGLPNVLLEAIACGLPVVASAVCGIPELINEDTGYPVSDWENPLAYVERIQCALSDAEARHARWERAIALIRQRHTADHFRENLLDINGYFSFPKVQDSGSPFPAN